MTSVQGLDFFHPLIDVALHEFRCGSSCYHVTQVWCGSSFEEGVFDGGASLA